jgi:superfamily II DNA or RNA helicase
MNKSFRDIALPETLEYRSDNDHIPLEFYISTFPISKKIDIHLGYFCSNALQILNSVFAQFIYFGGSMRLIISNILSKEDKENLLLNPNVENEKEIAHIFSNLFLLSKELEGGQHFFDCLRYLIKKDRLEIIPVITKSKSLSHYKNILLYDDRGNTLYTEGSANFTASGILTNGESFNVSRSWGNEPELKRIKKAIIRFEEIFTHSHKDYIYLKPEDIKNAINEIGKDRNAEELLIESRKLLTQNMPYKVGQLLKEAEKSFLSVVDHLLEEPRFPYNQPRRYQVEAYNSWVNNGYKGIFAMATGTGKTLTALYCLIEEYKKTGKQRNIFVVPGEELIRQWGAEAKDCNFRHIFLWYSKNNNLKKDIENIKVLKDSNFINIIITYESFKTNVFQSVFQNVIEQFTIVFDEVHNMGAIGFMDSMRDIKFERIIGLSATPLRLWDEVGENEFIENIFNSHHPDYTFNFPMEKAIGTFLVKYNYFPFFTSLTDDEFDQYLKLTAKIPFGKEGKINTMAALRRQLLLDQAENKTEVLIEIINELVHKRNFYWTLVYCPKGRLDDQDEDRIIHCLGEKASKKFPSLNIQFFVGETKDRDLLLKDFEKKIVHMLFAIKVLDEGVNVPMAQNAIFLASGKNYREFVQRRGRILRKYKTEEYEKSQANIYDIVVLPTLTQYNSNKNTAKKLIIAEFRRLFEFYKMSIPNEAIFWKIENELRKFGLTQYYIENLIENE